jgi:hypothetical protein
MVRVIKILVIYISSRANEEKKRKRNRFKASKRGKKITHAGLPTYETF